MLKCTHLKDRLGTWSVLASALAGLDFGILAERFFRPARSRSVDVAALRQAESDAAGRKKIRTEPKDWFGQTPGKRDKNHQSKG